MTEDSNREKTIPFYPDHVSTEFKVVVGMAVLTLVVGIIGLLHPVGLDAPADPMDTPEHTKPEWYFLFLYELLKYVPKSVGVIIPILALGLMTLWPFIDRAGDSQAKRRNRIIVTSGALLAVLVLTVLGFLS